MAVDGCGSRLLGGECGFLDQDLQAFEHLLSLFHVTDGVETS